MLRTQNHYAVLEQDEALMAKNNGRYPHDNEKDRILLDVGHELLERKNIIYLTSYFQTIPSLAEIKSRGFMTILLDVPLEILKQRNTTQMQEENYQDASQWFAGQLKFYEIAKKKGLIDHTIVATKSSTGVATEIDALIRP